MRQRSRGGATARGGHRRCRRLGDRIARGAGILRPDVPDHLKVAGHVIQNLSHVLAELGHALAAVGAFASAVIARLMHHLLARQKIGGGGGRWVWGGRPRTNPPGWVRPPPPRFFAASSAPPACSSSSRSSSCSICRVIRSDERPNCMRRNLAICSLSFSISSALYCTESSATFNSLWQASAKACNSAGSVGSSAVASDMSKLYSVIL